MNPPRWSNYVLASGTDLHRLLADHCAGANRDVPLRAFACIEHDVERDALGSAASARKWMREHCIHPTHAEWMSLMEARAMLQAVVRGGQSSSALVALLRAAAPTLGLRIAGFN